MSDERPSCGRLRFNFAGIEGKEILLFELFEARHWHIRQGMRVYPSIRECESVDWSKRYRVRVKGRWFGKKGFKCFFTLPEIATIAERMLECNNLLDMV